MARRQISLEKKPPGWIVKTQESQDGLLLYWYAPMSLWPRFSHPLVVVWLALAVVLLLLGNLGVFPETYLIVLFGLWAVTTTTILIERRNLHRARLPEATLLGPDWFGYYAGSVATRRSVPLPCWPLLVEVDVKQIYARAAADLGQFLIERRDGRRQILFQRDDRQVEIGKCLDDAERIWLYDLLEKWRQGIDVQKRRDATEINQAIADWVKHWSNPNQTGIIDKKRGS